DAADDLVALPADGIPGNVECALRDRDIMFECVFLDDLGCPGIGVHEPGGTESNKAADNSDQRLGPNGAERKFEAPALLTAGDDRGDDTTAGKEGEDPAPERADRGEGAIAGESLCRLRHLRH